MFASRGYRKRFCKIGPKLGGGDTGGAGHVRHAINRHAALSPTEDGSVSHAQLCGQADGRVALLREVFGEHHAGNVQSSHKNVKANCATIASASSRALCDRRGMPKAHPKRPHLHAWRKHFDKTLLWLASELGTAHSTLQRAEKGISGVDETTFRAIAAIYGITPAELSVAPSEAAKARQLDRILLRLRHLSPESLRTIADLSEQLPDQAE